MILSLLTQGVSPEGILDDYHGLVLEDIRACTAYAHALIAGDMLAAVSVADAGGSDGPLSRRHLAEWLRNEGHDVLEARTHGSDPGNRALLEFAESANRSSITGDKENHRMGLTELIARAPWREAVTYRDTWPHEYVLLQKDDQRELLEAVCQRLRDGEGVPCRFFAMRNAYLFIGDYKYWLMTPPDQVDWNDEEVLNRAPLYRDRRDFVIQDGDSGMRIDYPSNPPH